MRHVKSWLIAASVALALAGGVAVIETASVQPVQAQGRGMEDHWRYHDGHWSQYNAADKRWYYTNGNHWFYNDGKAWHPYAFDGHFGRKGFERGTYVVPTPQVKIVHPRHTIYVP
jgi:hypothetical protein